MNQIERVAYHEAGHAVIGILNRHSPRYVSVRPSGDHDGLSKYRLHGAGEPSTLTVHRAIMASLGGQLAEERASGEPSTGAGSDQEAIADMALRASGSEAEANALVTWLTERTRNQLTTYWWAVEVVASNLLWNERLSGADVRKIIDQIIVSGSLTFTPTA